MNRIAFNNAIDVHFPGGNRFRSETSFGWQDTLNLKLCVIRIAHREASGVSEVSILGISQKTRRPETLLWSATAKDEDEFRDMLVETRKVLLGLAVAFLQTCGEMTFEDHDWASSASVASQYSEKGRLIGWDVGEEADAEPGPEGHWEDEEADPG